MDYQVWRRHSITSAYDKIIKDFLGDYNSGQPTVVLLPGGMGSQLSRSEKPYNEKSKMPPDDYDPVWIDWGTIFCCQAHSLSIDGYGHDHENHVIVADGPVHFYAPFIKDVTPYSTTKRFFKQQNFNFVVFAYDWRRPLDESAVCLQEFLKKLKDEVLAKHKENPLPNLTLLAHSQGGLVAKIFLHRVADRVSECMGKLITVATPFYGTWSHQQRYFIGEPALSRFYKKKKMARIIATLAGPYSLMFLPKSTFDSYGEAIGLDMYPMRYSDGSDADPYNKINLGSYYPDWVSEKHLEYAGQLCQTLAMPLPQGAEGLVYNIRSVACRKTPVELVWHPLPENFNPDNHDCPIKKSTCDLGDGTVPYWSAYHAGVPDENRRELTGKDVKGHAFLMEDSEVLRTVYQWITGEIMSEKEFPLVDDPSKPCLAPISDMEKLFHEIAQGKVGYEYSHLSLAMQRRIFQELMR